MFFKWGQKYRTPKDVSLALDGLGASYNAFTANEYAWYYVKVAPQYIRAAMDVLSDMLLGAQFPKQEMETEKWVVIQEIMMYEDMPNRLVHDKWWQWYYGDNPSWWSILWPKENVQAFTQDDLFRHKHALYTKDNLVVVVAWHIPDVDAVRTLVGEYFDRLPATKDFVPEHYPQHKPDNHQAWYEKGTQQHHLVIGADWWTMHDHERYPARLLSAILWWTMSSRLFQHIREKQWLCYYIGSAHWTWDEKWVFAVYAWMEKERRDAWLAAIYDEIAQIQQHGITDDEYKQVRDYIQWSLAMNIETSDDMANYVAKQLLYKWAITSLDDHCAAYLAVTKEQINTVAQALAREQLYAYWIE